MKFTYRALNKQNKEEMDKLIALRESVFPTLPPKVLEIQKNNDQITHWGLFFEEELIGGLSVEILYTDSPERKAKALPESGITAFFSRMAIAKPYRKLATVTFTSNIINFYLKSNPGITHGANALYPIQFGLESYYARNYNLLYYKEIDDKDFTKARILRSTRANILEKIQQNIGDIPPAKAGIILANENSSDLANKQPGIFYNQKETPLLERKPLRLTMMGSTGAGG